MPMDISYNSALPSWAPVLVCCSTILQTLYLQAAGAVRTITGWPTAHMCGSQGTKISAEKRHELLSRLDMLLAHLMAPYVPMLCF